jgi:hypothetical protein
MKLRGPAPRRCSTPACAGPSTFVERTSATRVGLARTARLDARALVVAALGAALAACGGEATPVPVPVVPLELVTKALPEAREDVAYSATLEARGGKSPYTFAASMGAWPAGLALEASTGRVTGTPTEPGRRTLELAVTDAEGKRVARSFELYVRPVPLEVVTSSAPRAKERSSYGLTIVARGGLAPRTFRVGSGALPAGLALAPTGELTGTPTEAGVASFVVVVEDAEATRAERALMIDVVPLVPMITTSTLTLGEVARPFEARLEVTEAVPPLTWRVSMGALPRGLQLDDAGVIAGTPSTPGRREFAVEVTDSKGRKDTRALGITVLAPLQIATRTLPAFILNQPVNFRLQGAGGRPPYTWALRNGGLPSGLTLSPEGVLSGSVSEAGEFPITVLMQDALGRPPISRPLTVRVADLIEYEAQPALAFPPVCTSTRVSYQTVEIQVAESFQIQDLTAQVDITFSDGGTYQGRRATGTERVKVLLWSPDNLLSVLCGGAAGLRAEDGCRVPRAPGAPIGVQATFPAPVQPDVPFRVFQGTNAQGTWRLQVVTVLPQTASNGSCLQSGTINSVKLTFRVDRRPDPYVIIGGFGTNNLIIDPWVRIAGGNQVPENSIALRATLWSPGPNGLREGGKGDDLPDPRVFAWSAVNLPRGTTMTPDGVVVGGPLTGEAQIVADDGQGNTVQRRLLIVSPDWNLRIRDF